MSEERKSALLKEINKYIDMLSKSEPLNVLPEETLSELHQALANAVSLIQHVEGGED